jgi:hypothetical protein
MSLVQITESYRASNISRASETLPLVFRLRREPSFSIYVPESSASVEAASLCCHSI